MQIPSWQRILLVVGGSAFALAAGASATVFAFKFDSPKFARKLAPYEATALARDFDAQVAADQSVLKRSDWPAAARRAAAAEPLNPGPLRILAATTTSAQPGDPAAGRFLRLAERISPRDLPSQLWLIEDAVARNDVTGAITHYDRALSIYPAVSVQLYPILLNALDSPDVVRALVPYLRANRPWVNDFLIYAIAVSKRRELVSALFRAYGGSTKVPAHRDIESQLIVRLIESDLPEDAREAALRASGGDRAALERFAIDDKTMNPQIRPLTWNADGDDSVDTRFKSDRGLEITVGSEHSGVAATRLMLLAPGAWTLRQTIEFPIGFPMADATWSARCATPRTGVPFWQMAIPKEPGRRSYANQLTVPANCRAVWFSLQTRGGDSGGEAQIVLRSVDLARR